MTENEITHDVIIEKLKEVSFFNIFENKPEVIEMIFGMCSTKSFAMGKAIIKEGDHGNELYILLSGDVDIVKTTLQEEPYTVTTLSADMGGINVGELALIDDDTRSASVIAKNNCQCIVINRDDFTKFGDEHPEIGLPITRALASQLSSKLRKTNSDVITLFSALVEEIAASE